MTSPANPAAGVESVGNDTAPSPGGRPHGSDPGPVAALRRSRVAGFVREHAWTLTVWASTFAWAITLVVIARDRYVDFRFARFDLGNMVQAVWSTSEGRPLEMTHPVTGEQVVRLVFHVDPILALLTPLWIVAPTPLTLAFAQVVIVALGALPVFWLARRHSGSERTGALLALAYLAYPWTAWAGLDAFHPVSLAIPLLLFGVWFLDTDRLVPFALCAILVAASGELMGVLVGALGIWYATARGRRTAGFAIAAGGAAWTFVALYVVVPAFSGDSSIYYGAFNEVGGSPIGILRTTITDPVAILTEASQNDDLLYVFFLGAPLAGAFLLAPGLAGIALIPLAVNLLSGFAGTTDPHEHYVSAILPFLFAAVAVGLSRLSPMTSGRVAALVLSLSVAGTISTGPWPGTLLGASSWDPLPTTPRHIRTLERAIELVPDGAPVSATNRVGSQLSARRYFYSVPVVGRAEWVVLEVADDWVPQFAGGYSNPAVLRAFQQRIERNSDWQQVFEQDGVFVFRKTQT